MHNKEIEIFLEYFFLYKWTNLEEDYVNLKKIKKLINEKNIKKNIFIKKILRLYEEDNN